MLKQGIELEKCIAPTFANAMIQRDQWSQVWRAVGQPIILSVLFRSPRVRRSSAGFQQLANAMDSIYRPIDILARYFVSIPFPYAYMRILLTKDTNLFLRFNRPADTALSMFGNVHIFVLLGLQWF